MTSWKSWFCIALVASQLSTSQTVVVDDSQVDDDNVLQIPSVKHLMNGFMKKPKSSEEHLNDPTCPHEQTGDFKLKENKGQGRYSVSKKEVLLNIKMKLRKPCIITRTSTRPSKAPPTTTSTTVLSTATTIPTTQSSTTARPTTSSTIPTTAPSTSLPRSATTVITSGTNVKPTNINTNSQECEDLPVNKEGLVSHNNYRVIHDAPRMRLNCDISKQAAEYAQILADLGSLVQSGYSQRPYQGENLAMNCTNSSNAGEVAKEAVKNWYNEVCHYNFDAEGPQKATDHFTQVVWKASTEVGLGSANKQMNGVLCTYLVARYKPQGNFDDGSVGYKDNVARGSFDESYCNNVKDGAGLDGGFGLKRTKYI